MPRRRRPEDDAHEPRQSRFAGADRDQILDAAPAGEVIFEAPELKPELKPAPRPRRAARAASLGLPFGLRDVDGTSVCWSCARPVDGTTAIRVGPGDSRCPSCGAKLPFVE
jgi:hypothetical protein